MHRRRRAGGFTLGELLIGAVVLALAVTAMLGAFISQQVLDEHARNLTFALNDANRVMERVRQQNMACPGLGVAIPPFDAATCSAGGAIVSWDDWLQRCGGGKTVTGGNQNELVTVTTPPGPPPDPLPVTVWVCWRHRGRVIGECNAALAPSDLNGNGVFESPAMLSTLVTCRQ